MNEEMLPENDKDLQLARRIGKLLDAKQLTAESLAQSEFEHVLGEFKQAESATSKTSPSPELSTKMWSAISSATQPHVSSQKGPGAKIITLRPALYRVAIAASFLLAAVIGWLVIQTPSSPALVAQADSEPFVYRLEDGSTVTLRPHSSLFEIEAAQNDVQFSVEGEAYFEVTSNPERIFGVQAGPAHVAVLGTTFNVTHRDSLISVYLEEGRIELTHLITEEQAILSPGQVGILSNRSAIDLSETIDPSEHLDWLDDQIVFKGKKLAKIVQELEFHFAISVVLPEDKKEETYTGDLPLSSVDAALEKLSFIMGGGRFEQTGPTRYRFESDQ
ncbi:MAG: FecR domain-containing protein [Rhodothermaceae bacterium]|nr:FecR domain-containing protein [Rhodothermaceae bacterium]